MTIAGRAVLATGANRGTRRALVEQVLSRGAKRVYAGARRPLAHPDERVTPLTLDVIDKAQIHAAFSCHWLSSVVTADPSSQTLDYRQDNWRLAFIIPTLAAV
ncbi:hypothetical protein GCM10029978_065800 [Actinoallomurus acanthiterrae]